MNHFASCGQSSNQRIFDSRDLAGKSTSMSIPVGKFIQRIVLCVSLPRIRSLVAFVLFSLLGINLCSAREWTSNDGRKLSAKGLYWLCGGVVLEREDNSKPIFLPYNQLTYDDQVYAINNLSYWVNDKIKMEAKTTSTTSMKTEVATGRYNLFVDLHTYDGYYFTGIGKLTPITKTVRRSGRVVEVKLSSFFGSDGVAGVEFYALKGSGPTKPYVYHSEVGVFSYSQMGSRMHFYAPQTSNFKGWVALVRSPNTGEIIQVGSSLRHLEKYVIKNVPKVAKFKVNTSQIKKSLLAERKAANVIFEKQRSQERVKKFGRINLSVAEATFGVGGEQIDVTDKIRAYAKDPTKTVKISSSGMGINNPKGYNRLCLSIAYLVNGRSYLVNIPRGDSRNIFELLRDPETPTKYPAAGFELVKASFGGGKNYADVTERVRELLSSRDESFRVNPSNLKKDPTPGWKKKLRITLKLNGATITKEWAEDRNVYFSKYSL